MTILNETSLEFWCKTGIAFVAANGYSMARELIYREKGTACGPWVLRDPGGDYVDRDYYRSRLMERNGFEFDTND